MKLHYPVQPSIEDERTAVGLPCGHHLSPAEVYFVAELIHPSAPRDIVSYFLLVRSDYVVDRVVVKEDSIAYCCY